MLLQYSRNDLLRLHDESLKVNRQTRKSLIENRIRTPRWRHNSNHFGIGEMWSVAHASAEAPTDHGNP